MAIKTVAPFSTGNNEGGVNPTGWAYDDTVGPDGLCNVLYIGYLTPDPSRPVFITVTRTDQGDSPDSYTAPAPDGSDLVNLIGKGFKCSPDGAQVNFGGSSGTR